MCLPEKNFTSTHFPRTHPQLAYTWGRRGPVKGASPGGPGRPCPYVRRSAARTGGALPEARPGGVVRPLTGCRPPVPCLCGCVRGFRRCV